VFFAPLFFRVTKMLYFTLEVLPLTEDIYLFITAGKKPIDINKQCSGACRKEFKVFINTRILPPM